jgi:photosystem II stability/assembly factor-like uncharacterized protein
LVTARLDAFAHIPHDVVTRVALSPAFPHDGIVFAIVRDVLFRSEDGGYEWQRLSSDLYGCWPTALAISPVFSIDQTLFVSCRQGQVYRSQDLGKSWAPYEQMLAREDIVFLVPSPGFAADRTLLALGSEGHLYRTTDGGGWSHILGDSSAITALDWAADLLVAGTASGTIHLSKDGGTTWRKVGQHPRGQRITCIEVPVRTSSAEPFFVGTDGEGVCRVCEGDGSFECANSSTANQPITDMASLFEHDRLTLFASAWDEALSRSSDGGATWTQYGSDLPRSSQADQYGEAHFKTLAVADDGTVFLGSFCGLWRSDDLGLSWVPLETTLHHIVGLDVAPAAGGGHTVGITTYGGGAYSTSNDRRSWQIHNFGVTNPRLGAMVYSPNYAQDETVFVAHYNAVLSSTDGGVHWRRPSVRPPGWIVRGLKGVILRVVSRFRALRHTSLSTYLRQTSRSYAFPSAVAVSPSFPDDHTVFAGLFPYGVVRSEDGGSTFAWMWDTQGSRVWSLVISPDFATDRTLFTSLTDGIYRSVDGGDHWVQMGQDAGLQDAVLAISPQYARDRTLFAGNATGLFRTQDAGKTWLRLHVEPHRGEEPIAGVAISPNFATSRQLLVQIRGGNLFVCRDLEDRFEATPTTAAGAGYEFSQLIFGKETAPLIAFSPDYVDDQTVYAASVQHLVRTADGGRTWEEIPRPVRYEAEASLMREFFFPTSLEGRWRSDTGKLYSNTQCIYSTRAHSKVTLHFVGSGVRWVGARGPDRGVASVFIDGTLRGKVDEFSAERAFSVELFSAEGLAPGPHTITIEVDGVRNARSSGTRVDIDALDVIRRG